VDGKSVLYVDVEAKYRYWKREVVREKGTRPQAASINLGGCPAGLRSPARWVLA